MGKKAVTSDTNSPQSVEAIVVPQIEPPGCVPCPPAGKQETGNMTPGQMLSLAVQQGADIQVLEKLMDLQDRHEKKMARLAYSNAIVQFQAICPTVVRTGFNSRFGNQYPQWSSAHVQIKKHLQECQLAVTHKITQDEKGTITVICECRHGPSGHVEVNQLSAAPDRLTSREGKAVRTEAQALASTITYLQCRTAFALLGIDSRDRAPEEKINPAVQAAVDKEDDDGNGTAPLPAATEQEKPKSAALLDSDVDGAKRKFASVCCVKAKQHALPPKTLQALLAAVQEASGKQAIGECADWLVANGSIQKIKDQWQLVQEAAP